MRHWQLLLTIIAVVCFGAALSYPIRYRMAEESNNADMASLSAMRARVISEMTGDTPESVSGTAGMEDLTNEVDRTAHDPQEQSGPAEAGTEPLREAPPDDSAPETGLQKEENPGGQPSYPQTQTETEETWDDVSQQMQSPKGGEPQADCTEESRPRQDEPDLTNDPASEKPGRSVPVSKSNDDENISTDRERATCVSPTPGSTLSPPPETKQTPVPTAAPTPMPTPDRSIRKGALPYPEKEKVTLDRSRILPELREIYRINEDLVGWLSIPGTVIDYPVVQCADRDYYLKHDFYKQENINGQIILDTTCDAFTPSYNLIISGHHMKNGSMFGDLPKYASESYWEEHRIIHFDTLMSRNDYVVFAAFYSADYDEDEKGFRYSADIRYRLEAEMWLKEIRENQLYDTGVDAEFGDEFITLTTCNRARHRDGRFVIVARKLREGETIE